jgi:mannose-1-phosphate guanylyltransferase/phosphomannomutase
MLLEMMARLEIRLHHLARSIPESHVVRAEVPCPNERKGAVMRRLIEETRGDSVELVEGVRVRRGESWVAAIPDPDRACFHVIGESSDLARARALVDDYKEKLAGWRREA